MEKRVIVKIEKVDSGLEATVSVNGANLNEVMAVDKALTQLREKLRETIAQQIPGLMKEMKDHNSDDDARTQEANKLSEEIKKKVAGMDKDRMVQLLKDIKGLTENC